MKFLLTTLLITSYVAIGTFWVFGMHAQAMGMQGHDTAPSNCIGATIKGVNCPKQAIPIDLVGFHIDAFSVFSLATFSENILASLLILTFLFIGIGLGSLLSSLASTRLNLAYSRQRSEQFSSPPKQQLLRWLALHENSPAIS